jgi:dUTP pyrophosphatase
MSSVRVAYHKLVPDVPDLKQATPGSACFDLAFWPVDERVVIYSTTNGKLERTVLGIDVQRKDAVLTLHPGERALVPTGIIFDLDPNTSLRVHPRSGLSLKFGLALANAEGVVDSDYVDPSYVLLTNYSQISALIKAGERIAQAEIVPAVQYVFEERLVRPGVKTNRTGGFGSTGQ